MREALDSLRGLGGDSLVRQMVAVFIDYSDGRITTLQSAVAAGDLAGVATAAHTLKGSSRQLGLAALADSCQAVEQASKNGDADAVRALAPAVRETFTLATAWLKAATA